MEIESDRIPGIRFVLDQGDDINAAAADWLVAEVERLRAALVEERAKWIALYDWEPRQGTWAAKDEARAELIAEGLLPPA